MDAFQHLAPLFLQELCPPPAPRGVVSDIMSLPSYREYPTHRPFFSTLVHHTPQTRTHLSCRPPSPSKAFPETNCTGNFNMYVCVVFPFTKFPFRYCGVSGLHGYSMCNMKPHYLDVSVAPTSIHSFTWPSLYRSYTAILAPKPKNNIWFHHNYYTPALNMFNISPCASYPVISPCVEILSALRNLQEKIRRLELEKGDAKLSLHTLGKEASSTRLQSDKVTQQLLKDHTDTDRERNGKSNCNQGGYINNILKRKATVC